MESNKIIPNISVNVILSVALAASFIGIFFFTYVKNVEKEIVVKNVNYTISNFTDLIKNLMSPVVKTELIKELNVSKLPNMNEEDNKVEQDNNILLFKSGKLLGLLLAISLIVAIGICYIYNLNFIEIFSQNLILLCGIALVEFLFLRLVISNYISADPNVVKKQILTVLKE